MRLEIPGQSVTMGKRTTYSVKILDAMLFNGLHNAVQWTGVFGVTKRLRLKTNFDGVEGVFYKLSDKPSYLLKEYRRENEGSVR